MKQQDETLLVDQLAVIASVTDHSDHIQIFFRILKGNMMFHSQKYSRVTQRNSFTVEYDADNDVKFGSVIAYIHVRSIHSTEVYALLTTFEQINTSTHLAAHILAVWA